MLSVNSLFPLLDRAVVALSPTAGPELTPQPLLKGDSPFFFSSSDFSLTETEETLLKEILHPSKLVPHVTLFDLLFFTLYRELLKLQNCVCPEDFQGVVETLQWCYATLVQAEKKDTSPLRDFLETLIRTLITSNNRLNFPTNGKACPEKAKGDTQFILDTLYQRVQLFKKFEQATACHPQLFNHPVSLLTGNGTVVIQSTTFIKEFFEKNGLFLLFVFNAFKQIDPNLEAYSPQMINFLETVRSFGNPWSPNFCKPAESAQIALGLDFVSDSLYPFNIILKSWPIYKNIAAEGRRLSDLLYTPQAELMIQTGKIPVLNPITLDPSDLLAQFRADRLIESSFRLTLEESTFLRELFTYPLDSAMTMLDILGYAFYDRLEDMKNTFIRDRSEDMKNTFIRFSDAITHTQEQISTHFLLFYVGLQRSADPTIELLGTVNRFSDQFSYSPSAFLKAFSKELEKLQDVIKQKIPHLRNSTRKRILQQFENSFVPLQNLLRKLLESKGYHQLLLSSLSMYQGSELLDQSHSNARAVLKRYWDYVNGGYKSKMIGCKINVHFPAMEQLLSPSCSLEQEIISLRSHFVKLILSAFEMLEKIDDNLVAIVQGRLDYETWIREGNLRVAYQKNSEEFKEQTFSQLELVRFQSMLFSDMLRLVERRILPPGALTTHSCYIRLACNIGKKQLDHTPSLLLPSTIPSKFISILESMQTYLGSIQPVLNNAIDTTSEAILEGVFHYARWLQILSPIEESIATYFENSLAALSSLQLEVLQELKNEWANRSLEQLQRLDVPAIQEAIFQEGVQLLRPLLILSDLLALLQRRSFSEEAAIIPFELANILQLDGIDEILQHLIREKTALLHSPAVAIESSQAAPQAMPDFPVAPQPAMISPQISQAPAQKASIEQQPKGPLKKPVIRQAKAAPLVPHMTEAQLEAQTLQEMTKAREILRKLKDLGFFEDHQTGSHHILRGPQNGVVVVPNNNSLPIGTRKSIADQAIRALGP